MILKRGTPGPVEPALLEFLEALGRMAGDAVLANYRENKPAGAGSIKPPRGNNSGNNGQKQAVGKQGMAIGGAGE
jgi:hypothetical protein